MRIKDINNILQKHNKEENKWRKAKIIKITLHKNIKQLRKKNKNSKIKNRNKILNKNYFNLKTKLNRTLQYNHYQNVCNKQ